MDYALAKQLKDAGFPQKSGPVWVHVIKKTITDKHTGYKHERPEGWVYHNFVALPQKGLAKAIEWCSSPRLKELIEACGEGFKVLYKHHDRFLASTDTLTDETLKGLIEENYGGSTPEIAVANLWLALNKK